MAFYAVTVHIASNHFRKETYHHLVFEFTIFTERVIEMENRSKKTCALGC
jgi:hypothetical protein